LEVIEMRLWSLHPRYLDARGLVALWREALLAKAVLEGKTRGYTRHPQLERFRGSPDPVAAINSYLLVVHAEATRRRYSFNREKLGKTGIPYLIPVTEGQLRYELEHLKRKLQARDLQQFEMIKNVDLPESHPLFRLVEGDVEEWERVIQ
jgi:uncharacterized lipoprotein YmbA